MPIAAGGLRFIEWLAVFSMAGCAPMMAQPLAPYRVVGNEIREPLGERRGDPARGLRVMDSRDGNCVLCHAVPGSGQRLMGDVGPSLEGIGRRLSAPQLRLRIVDSTRINPQSVMPAYYRIDGLNRVAPAYRGKPILTAQQIEDVVAYLAMLR